MRLWFIIAAGPHHLIRRFESRRTHDILLFQIGNSPNLEGQVPVFVTPRNMVALLYPQVPGSLFVASYDSQGYGGGIRPRLHMRTVSPIAYTPFIRVWHGSYRKRRILLLVCIRCRGNVLFREKRQTQRASWSHKRTLIFSKYGT
jgi:hypothetical protein